MYQSHLLTMGMKGNKSKKTNIIILSKFEKPTDNQFKDWVFIILIVSIFYFSSSFVPNQNQQVMGQNLNQTGPANITNIVIKPLLSDPDLKIESVATGFDFPTGIAFLGNNDILLLEKTPEKCTE